ncbi:hypothetical protein BGW38_005832 [Lunasporangiospora selenospora]|uniref:Protein kinase domain-containing protein n=1 Tax=Lunasporangiospora selenospora TaxID=979761 RepID=A0A9P6FMY7_9FUNG|nr:hypothetical protein BGW38_005832 [Lunasporangiospora selenospora]
MVERRGVGKLYALKYISKSQVIKMDAVRNVLRERQILETLDHAFVVNMRFAFQDDEYMYMCMDLMMGGDLRFHLNRKQFGEDVVRFWIAELCAAVTHLHSQGIVHRDIKPDNVLLDEKGHAHLTDFNIGCKLTPDKPFLTSQSGTVFKGTGYGTTIDWWAMGVMFYECIYNKRPFQTDNIADLKKAIPTQPIEYPEKESVSRECLSAMRGFLTRDPNERLGVKGGMENIRQHPFFQAGTYQSNPENWWYMLETKQLTPKFQPSSDHVNFDATYDLEELLLDDEPLTYRSTRKRAQRMQKEKDKAMKEEYARLKAEHEAAVAAAELGMAGMGISADDHHLCHPNDARYGQRVEGKKSQKWTKAHLGGMGSAAKDWQSESNSSSTNSSHFQLSQPTMVAHHQQQHQHHSHQHGTQPYPVRQHPVHSPSGSEYSTGGDVASKAVHSLPPVQFPTPPPPLASKHSSHNVRMQSNAYSRHPSAALLPPPPTSSPPLNPTQQQQQQQTSSSKSGDTTIAAAAPGGGSFSYVNTGSGQTTAAVYLSKPAVLNKDGTYSTSYDQPSGYSGSPRKSTTAGGSRGQYPDPMDVMTGGGRSMPASSQYHMPQYQQQQQQYQQQASYSTDPASSPPNVPVHQLTYPLPTNRRDNAAAYAQSKYPSQGPPPPRQQPSGPAQRNPSPSPAFATPAKVPATIASSNMSRKEKIAYQMALIDREFTTFDYTVYEEYNGLVDPVTMSVGDPPEWVKSRDY